MQYGLQYTYNGIDFKLALNYEFLNFNFFKFKIQSQNFNISIPFIFIKEMN